MAILSPVERNRPSHDPEWHLAKLLEFYDAKKLVGEPSPHMTIVNHLSHDLPQTERLWRIGAYLVPYSVVTANAIWSAWPSGRLLLGEAPKMAEWVRENWEGMHTRTERRMVRTAPKFIRSLTSWWEFVESGTPQRLLEQRADYEAWWKAVNRVEFFGRYISIRAIEAIRRDAERHGQPHPEMELQDIRSIGGDSPVRALTMFTPGWFHPLLLTDAGHADDVAEQVLQAVRDSGSMMNHYEFAAMLCEYREAYEDGHQYPGRTIDQELTYMNGKHIAYWEGKGYAMGLRSARRDLFPHEALGEVNGWTEVRPELSHLLRDWGIVWSDMRYQWTGGKDEADGLLHPRDVQAEHERVLNISMEFTIP
jgi:hypothetical protein